jgi:hypothetical protein
MPCDFVISDIQWASAADLLCPIHDATGSTCASRTPSGARWSGPLPPSIPSPHVDPHCPKRSVTCSSLTPALCSALKSRGRRCATHRAASRTGSAGVWREPSAPLHPADGSRVDEARHNQIHWLRRVPQTQTRPRNRGRSRSCRGRSRWQTNRTASLRRGVGTARNQTSGNENTRRGRRNS